MDAKCQLFSSTSLLAPCPASPSQNRPFSSISKLARSGQRTNALQTVAAATKVKVAAAPPAPATLLPSPRRTSTSAEVAERTIMECLTGVTGRGKGGMPSEQQAAFDSAVAQLEKSLQGTRAPAASPLLEGRWRLLYTSRPGTASPIQRTFTGVDAFTVYQEIISASDGTPMVNNVVDFGPTVGYLKVEAEASTDARPLPNFTPRKGKGLPFGILGVSSTTPPSGPNVRIDFQFVQADFYFKSLPFTIPYPVPFRLLGDECKGWIDTTYLSKDGKFRLTRGNKGTLFVLVKDDPPQTQLLDKIKSQASEEEVIELAEAVAGGKEGVKDPARSTVATGAWRLIWTKQGATANPLQRRLANSVRNWQLISSDGAKLENRVEILPGIRVRAIAESEAQSGTRSAVVINDVIVEIGPLKLPLPITKDARGYIDWLYLDEGLRITQGNKGSVFIHVRDEELDADI